MFKIWNIVISKSYSGAVRLYKKCNVFLEAS